MTGQTNLLSILLFVSILSVYGSASGAPPITQTRTVNYADLNLNHPAGVKALYGRISAAARVVCDRRSDLPMANRAAAQKCMREAIAGAIADVDNYNLTAYHLEQSTASSTAAVAARR